MWKIGRPSARQTASSAAIAASAPGLLRGPHFGSSMAICTSMTRSAASLGRRMSASARQQEPDVEIEHDAGLITFAFAKRKIVARAVFGRDQAHAQRADVVAAGQDGRIEDFAPGEHRIAREQRRDMPPAVDRRDMERIGEAVEAERARERDDVAAVDQPPPEPALRLAELVEMHLGGVLIETGRDLMLGLLY